MLSVSPGDRVVLSDAVTRKRLLKYQLSGEPAVIIQCRFTADGEQRCLVRFEQGRGIHWVPASFLCPAD